LCRWFCSYRGLGAKVQRFRVSEEVLSRCCEVHERWLCRCKEGAEEVQRHRCLITGTEIQRWRGTEVQR